MLKTIFTLFVLAAAAPTQSSSDGPFSWPNSQDMDSSFRPAQIRQAESFCSQCGTLDSNVFPSASASLPTIRKEVQEVNLLFTVTDHHRHFVRNLAASDFTILDNGEPPERITHFESQSELPLRLAIVIDSSDSMAYAFKDEKQAAADFVKRIVRRPSDLALVMGFNQEVRLVQELASDNGLLSRAIRQLHIGGNTAIYDAISAACQQLAKVEDTEPARRAIILLTDGEENSSHIKLEEAEEVAQRNECAVYVLSINPTGFNPEQTERAMKELSEVTGGNLLQVRTQERVTIAFSNIDKELRSQYLISYKPPSIHPDGSFHRIVVLGPNKFRIHHRDGYFAR